MIIVSNPVFEVFSSKNLLCLFLEDNSVSKLHDMVEEAKEDDRIQNRLVCEEFQYKIYKHNYGIKCL